MLTPGGPGPWHACPGPGNKSSGPRRLLFQFFNFYFVLLGFFSASHQSDGHMTAQSCFWDGNV